MSIEKKANLKRLDHTQSTSVLSNLDRARKILAKYKNLDLQKELVLMRKED